MRPELDAVDRLAVIPDAAVELDGGGLVVGANGRASEVFACSRDQLLGQPIDRYLPDASLPELAMPGHRRVQGRRHGGVPVVLDVSTHALVIGGERRLVCSLREVNRDRLAEEVQLYFDVAFDNAPIGKALFNCDGEYVRVNAALCELLGRTREDLLGRRDQELTHPDDRQADVDVAWEILEGKYDTHQCEKRFVRPDGTVVWTLANLTFVRDQERRPLGWFGQFQDITARRRAEEATREAEERFRLAFEHAPIGIALVSPDGDWLRVNDRLCEMLGYRPSELLARTFQDLTHPDDLADSLRCLEAMRDGEVRNAEMEKRYLRADGSVLWILLSVSLVRNPDGTPRYFISQIQDIDRRKQFEHELGHLAHHDPLTGLPNRRAWDDAMARAVETARRTGGSFAVALLDINRFKQVNDSRGHSAGDRLLVEAAAAWSGELREGDLLCRIGGDEFALLLPDVGHGDALAITERLKQALPHHAGCAVGFSAFHPGMDAAELMHVADDALYQDKPAARR